MPCVVTQSLIVGALALNAAHHVIFKINAFTFIINRYNKNSQLLFLGYTVS